MTKMEWLTAHGFNEDGITYCVYGDDTYSIKNWLKEQGCKFDPIFKWHCGSPIEMLEGYKLLAVSYSDFMEWDEKDSAMLYYEDAKAKIERKFQEMQEPSTAEFYEGEIGERIRNVTAVFKSYRGFNGKFGYTNILTFETEKHCLVWFTATEQDLEVGDTVDMTFTIKAFQEFRGVNTTIVTRCKIKKIGN